MKENYTCTKENKIIFSTLTHYLKIPDICDLLTEEYDEIYFYAYDFHHKGKLDEAENFFRFLCMYDFLNPDYYFGLATVYKLKKEYKKAINAYAIVFELNKNDYKSLYLTAECQVMLGEKKAAKINLQRIYKESSNKDLSLKAKNFLHNLKEIDTD